MSRRNKKSISRKIDPSPLRDYIFQVSWFVIALILTVPPIVSFLGSDVCGKGRIIAFTLVIFGKDSIRHIALTLLGHGGSVGVDTTNSGSNGEH